jgi:tetratricopeptide (TPR) repeat protein
VGVADAHRDAGNRDAARPLYLQRLELAEAELAKKPDSPVWKREVANSHGRLGDLALRLGNAEEAARALGVQVRLLSELREGDPTSIRARVTVASAQVLLATAQLRLGRLAQAMALLKEAHEVYSFMVMADSQNYNWLTQSGNVNHRLGEVFQAEGRSNEAVTAFTAAIKFRKSVVALDPDNEAFRNNLSLSLEGLALAQEKLSHPESALANFRSARKERGLAGDTGETPSAEALARIDSHIRALER